MTSIAAPDLEETTSGDVRIKGAVVAGDFLQSIDLKKLRAVGGSFAVAGQTHASFASLDVSALETVAGFFNVSDNVNLDALNVKNLRRVSGGALKITGNANALSVRDLHVSSSQRLPGIFAGCRDPQARVHHGFHVSLRLVHRERVDEVAKRGDGAGIEGVSHLLR